MEKIKLKPWQKWLLFGLLIVLAGFVVISTILNRVDTKKNKPVSISMNIDIQPNDTTSRIFFEGKVAGDSMRFETIRGADVGWIFEIYAVGMEADYILLFDFRQTEHLWKKGEKRIFVGNLPEKNSNAPIGLMRFRLQSRLKMAENYFLTDEVEFSKYYLSLNCNRFDSLASFDAVFYGEEYLRNPEFSDEKIILKGKFNADSIRVGRRQVN